MRPLPALIARAAALALLAIAAPAALPADPPAAPPPSVVVVVIDDMCWEDLFHAPTPNMIGLALQGRVYTNFYVHPVCSPTRAALATGVYPVRDDIVGAIGVGDPADAGLPTERLTLAEALHASGWATACFGKWHVSTVNEARASEFPRIHGFEHWHDGVPGNIGKEGSSTQSGWFGFDDGTKNYSTVYSAERITDGFEAWWTNGDARPRFALVAYTTPHEPWTTPPPHLLPPGYTHAGNKRGRYEASLVALDQALGRIAALVDLSTTYVIVVPDNGTPHQVEPPTQWYKGYKLTVYQGGVHVPMLVAGPGVAPGFSDRLAHAVDVPSTVLDLCGLDVEFGFEDSISFAPSLSGTMPKREPVLVQYKVLHSTGATIVDDWAVVDADGWKLVSVAGKRELYRLSSDPFETTPLNVPNKIQSLTAYKQSIDP